MNIVDNMDQKVAKDYKLKLDDEFITTKDYSELLNLKNIENVKYIRINLENGAMIDVEMEGTKLNLI